MATKVYEHDSGKFTIKVPVRRGSPIVNSRGMIDIIGVYKGCNSIQEEIFNEKFKEIEDV